MSIIPPNFLIMSLSSFFHGRLICIIQNFIHMESAIIYTVSLVRFLSFAVTIQIYPYCYVYPQFIAYCCSAVFVVCIYIVYSPFDRCLGCFQFVTNKAAIRIHVYIFYSHFKNVSGVNTQRQNDWHIGYICDFLSYCHCFPTSSSWEPPFFTSSPQLNGDGLFNTSHSRSSLYT